jgi:putative phosphoesterase
MLVGILSDLHGRLDATQAAVELLRGRGAEYFVVCGDVGSPDVLERLRGLGGAVVAGNCDWDRPGLMRRCGELGLRWLDAVGFLDLDAKRLAVTHGDDVRILERVLSEGRCDYLLTGHTHVALDLRAGRTRIINPGALHRAKVRTVALLDPAADRLEFLSLEKRGHPPLL